MKTEMTVSSGIKTLGGCDGGETLPSEERAECAVCGRTVGEKDAYYDTYYQPLCAVCLMELHKL